VSALVALLRTALLAGVLGIGLYLALGRLAQTPHGHETLVALLALPSGLLLALRSATDLRAGEHISWRMVVQRRRRPLLYGLCVGGLSLAATALLAMGLAAALAAAAPS